MFKTMPRRNLGRLLGAGATSAGSCDDDRLTRSRRATPNRRATAFSRRLRLYPLPAYREREKENAVDLGRTVGDLNRPCLCPYDRYPQKSLAA